jgi:hypothetical protein
MKIRPTFQLPFVNCGALGIVLDMPNMPRHPHRSNVAVAAGTRNAWRRAQAWLSWIWPNCREYDEIRGQVDLGLKAKK